MACAMKYRIQNEMLKEHVLIKLKGQESKELLFYSTREGIW